MCFDKESKVRRSIANSFADVAELLGPEITEKELVPIFEKFFKDESNNFINIFSRNKNGSFQKFTEIFKKSKNGN